MLSKTVVMTVFLAAGTTLAQAQEIGGRYQSQGTDPAGALFSGTVEIIMVSENTCTIRWNDGSEGICMLNGTALSAAYLVHGKLGLASYQLSPDGSLEGSFIDNLHGGGLGNGGGVGSEKLVPAG